MAATFPFPSQSGGVNSCHGPGRGPGHVIDTSVIDARFHDIVDRLK